MTLDIASQVLKSRNAGVLRTGSVALRSSEALMAHVVALAMRDAGLAPGALQLTPHEGRCATHALVSLPDLVPLVILRDSGESRPATPAGLAVAGVIDDQDPAPGVGRGPGQPRMGRRPARPRAAGRC
ncbi:hypothetical protein [Streptomyces guryensis]|uniref:Uncharacterized protein n=1 Tax=Streptomyces guryensis TaxID=2886947 RepID=A0A9Q3ZAX2_9ACTN|nr:hypothetical protein [Streptomyces guryensis]MCD9875760.1 hypothetical protein [Streptomyces guryensis]